MFSFELHPNLEKKVFILSRKNKILIEIFRKKVEEVIIKDELTIDLYKNLKFPMNEFKRIHLTDNFILLFKVSKKEKHIMFFDIKHRDDAYK